MFEPLDYLNKDYYLNYPLIKAIEHGFDVVCADDRGVLLADEYPTFALLSSSEPLSFLRHFAKPELMEVFGAEAGKIAQSHFGFENALKCHQYYYPLATIDSDLELELAKTSDVSLISQHYALADEQEIRETIEKGIMWVLREENQVIGFIGRHMDGSMGMMEVLPAYRRLGWGEKMERAVIKIVLSEGDLPYGHVVIGNTASQQMQEKLGFIRCSETVTWLW